MGLVPDGLLERVMSWLSWVNHVNLLEKLPGLPGDVHWFVHCRWLGLLRLVEKLWVQWI